MEDLYNKIQFGLEKLTLDTRDYSHHENFGTLGSSLLPAQDFTIYDAFQYTIKWGDTMGLLAKRFGFSTTALLVANPKIVNINKIYVGQVITIPARKNTILNQINLDFCTGFTTVELQNAIWGTENDPLYQFAKISQVKGEYQSWGANLRHAVKSAVKYGSLPLSQTPYSYNGNPTDKPRDFLANWANWPAALDIVALKEKDLSFFEVDGPLDIFDDIRSALSIHRQERRGVSFGIFWHSDWTYVQGGIIPEQMPAGRNGGGHDMAIVGQKTINGKLYLVFQQSWGPNAGNQGFYYFPRSVVNQAFMDGYGAFTMSNQDKSGLTGTSILTSIATIINNILGRIK